MGLFKTIFSQTKKPEGFWGRMMVKSMNSGHSKMAAWGAGHLPALEPGAVVDLGCGGGQNTANLLERYPAARVTAIDYSDVSVEKTRTVNAEAIKAGRCTVLQGDVSALPLAAESFDLATAFETIYFWPGPVKSFREVYRVLRDHGSFLIVNECDGTNEKDQKWLDMIDGMVIYQEDELVGHLKEAGFAQVQVFRDEAKHWICFLARKD